MSDLAIWDTAFTELSSINILDINDPKRSERLTQVLKFLPEKESDVFKRMTEIEQHIARLLFQYTTNIIEKGMPRNVGTIRPQEETRRIISEVPPKFFEIPLVNNIKLALLKQKEDLDLKAHRIWVEKQSGNLRRITAEQKKAHANREEMRENERMTAAYERLLNSYIKEKGVIEGKRKFIKALNSYDMHAELYNKQQDKLDKIRGGLASLCTQECVDLITQLKIEFPIAPWQKYLQEGGSKKSKTRRRRRN